VTTSNLKAKAQAAAAQSWAETDPAAVAAHTIDPPPPARQEALVPFAELPEPTSDDPEQVPVAVAWGRVMRDVHAIGKNSLYNQSGTRYNFRGVDAVINAFGPACRRHGVIVVPHRVTPSHAPAVSKGGSAMRETTTVVRWHIVGPKGDHIEGESEGESLDTGDKGTAKAQSVALRMFLLAAGLVPTDDKDPDAQHVERGEQSTVRPGQYVEEILDERTSLARLKQISGEIARHGIAHAVVQNEHGEDEKLIDLFKRIVAPRRAAAETGGAE